MNYYIKHIENIGSIPKTPINLLSKNCNLQETRTILLEEAYKLGYPVSFVQEQKGALIQNIFPVNAFESSQISTSSKVELGLHTETAFHSHKPDYVLLLCLRGDPNAATTLASVDDIVKDLDKDTIDCLRQPWYSTNVDLSFERYNNKDYSEVLTPILFYQKESYSIVYDHEFMKPKNFVAELALELFRLALLDNIKEISLKDNELLVIDNRKVVHGRKPFRARYDGSDRWLQRILVKKEVDMIENKKINIIDSFETFLIETELN
jgi:alpha-ketoglutarate-dependent taurine dioxygenase